MCGVWGCDAGATAPCVAGMSGAGCEFEDRVFFFNDTATTEIYTLSLHDALPICRTVAAGRGANGIRRPATSTPARSCAFARSEEHTSELQSRQYLVCRLLLEKKTRVGTNIARSNRAI